MRITTVQLWRPRVSCAVLCPPAASNDCGSVLAVSVSEAGVTSPVSEARGTVPLGLVAAPVPALSDNSDCVLAESAEVGSVSLAEEAAIQS